MGKSACNYRKNAYFCTMILKNKKFMLLMLGLLLCSSVFGQRIRTNYRNEGFTHISTDYESIQLADVPALGRVELVGFPDGSTIYLLYLNLVQKNAVTTPKGVKMSVLLNNEKLVRLDQIGQDSATKRRMEDGNFHNRLKYAVEPQDMEKMLRGIKSIDVITGWNPEDYLQATFKADELGSFLKRHCEAILKAADTTIELTATASGYTENANSIMATANPIVGRGASLAYNIILSHLYYKNSGQEDIDLAIVLGSENKYHVPYDAPVRFTLRDGSEITLIQARDDINFVYLYPSMEDMYRLTTVGVAGISIAHENGTVEDTFPKDGPEDFTAALSQEFQLLLSMSPR